MVIVNNAEKFKQIFGIYATELWAMPEEEFLKWLDAVESMPSVEAEPVRHGKWLDGYGFAGNYYDCFVCDQCKKESMAKTNYCPNCGADMREADDERLD